MVARTARLAGSVATSSLSANGRRKPKPPPRVPGVHWVRNNAGWDARDKANLHIAYLGAREWGRMQREFQGAALIEALQVWIEQKRLRRENEPERS